jgi:hypothetical protein
VNIWTNEILDRAKNTADPLADQVVEDLMITGKLHQINDVLAGLDENDEALPEGLPSSLTTYLDESALFPSWTDFDKIKIAQDLFIEYGPNFGVALMFQSLPTLYAGSKGGAQILYKTGQMGNHFQRRASETLRFILDAMEPGGLSAGGKGIRAIQKVRMMHAAIRLFSKKSGVMPEDGSWGEPINLEEMAGTLVAFSAIAMQGIEKLGVNLSIGEKDAYMHTWRVIGNMLGIKDEFIPKDVESAYEQWSKLDIRNFARTEAGVELMKSHVDFLEKMIPGKIVDGVVPAMMRYLMGNRVAVNILGVKSQGWWLWLIDIIRIVFRLGENFMDSSAFVKKFMASQSHEMMEALQKYWSSVDSGVPFRVPESLTKRNLGRAASEGNFK